MSVLRAAAVALVILVVVGLAPTTVRAAGPACERTSWIAGSVDLCEGALVYRDYVYDDYGAGDPLDPTSQTVTVGSLSPTAGDARYPEGAEATADLVDLTLAVDGDELVATFELNALYEPDQTVAALAIDTDDDASTGGGAWVDGDLDLGVASDGWDLLATFRQGDPETNLVVGRVPLPDGDTWRVQAVTAQADGTVMNVAFRGTDETTDLSGGEGTWFEGRQAAALAGGDISEFGHTVAVADLRDGVTRPAELVPGYHQRVHTSAYTIGTGEGMSYEGVPGRHGDSGEVCEQFFHFYGPYQPYGVYVPEPDGDDVYGIQLALHGCNANHASLVEQPGMQARFGDELDRIVAVPLGRGPVGYYSDISERDVLEVLADLEATYTVDLDRVFSGGYSMGGYGAYRFAQLYPDRFAGMVNWVGFTGDGGNNPTGQNPAPYTSGAIGNVIDLVGNLQHIPSALLYAGADELVHTTTHTAMALAFDQAGVPYEYFLHPYAEHLTFALADGWEKEAAYTEGLRRVQDPPSVRYRTDLAFAYPEYGIVHDRAYWLSGIANHEDGYTDVEATTYACGGELATYEEGADAGVGPAAFAWTSRYRAIAGSEPLERADRLELTASNLSEITIDAEATCLAGRGFDLVLTSDGPLRILLSDGREVVVGPTDGAQTFRVEASGAAAAPEGAAEPAAEALPATGGGASIWALLAAAGGAVSWRRRRP